VDVRPLVPDDLGWVVDLAARRAEQRERFAPRFWRRAADARRIHAGYLGSLVDDPAVPALRTDHLFAFALPQPGFLLVDDAAAEEPGHWAAEGPELFRRLLGGSAVRFVCPAPEPDRAALALRLGLTIAETWWHRDLAGTHRPVSPGPLRVPGADGRLVTAPPVYAPGGPVLLVTGFDGRPALAEMERAAAARGAVVSVVTHPPEGDATEYRRTCDFYTS
jgi:hypothetical protein